MEYQNIVAGRFRSRPNRFVALVEVEGKEIPVHVKNTGRCRELLVPDAVVYLEDFSLRMGNRKMTHSLIGVEKVRPDGSTLLINMDSQAPNRVVEEALRAGRLSLPGLPSIEKIKAEAVYGTSRLDFALSDPSGCVGYLEVKGVTLEADGLASFPDAPTLRGIKHLRELAALAQAGHPAAVLFVIQMKGVTAFTPNRERHAAFGDALLEAMDAGVSCLAYDCVVTPATLTLADPVPLLLHEGSSPL